MISMDAKEFYRSYICARYAPLLRFLSPRLYSYDIYKVISNGSCEAIADCIDVTGILRNDGTISLALQMTANMYEFYVCNYSSNVDPIASVICTSKRAWEECKGGKGNEFILKLLDDEVRAAYKYHEYLHVAGAGMGETPGMVKERHRAINLAYTAMKVGERVGHLCRGALHNDDIKRYAGSLLTFVVFYAKVVGMDNASITAILRKRLEEAGYGS